MLQYGLIISGLAALVVANWIGNVPPHILIPATTLSAAIFTGRRHLPPLLVMLVGGLAIWSDYSRPWAVAPALAFEAARDGQTALAHLSAAAAEASTIMRLVRTPSSLLLRGWGGGCRGLCECGQREMRPYRKWMA